MPVYALENLERAKTLSIGERTLEAKGWSAKPTKRGGGGGGGGPYGMNLCCHLKSGPIF